MSKTRARATKARFAEYKMLIQPEAFARVEKPPKVQPQDAHLDSGEGLKYDSGKVPLELVSDIALEELAKVLAFGARKYAPDNWRKGMAWRRLIGAAKRHLGKFSRGIDRDEETGLLELAHLFCCVMFLLEYQITGNGTDDRWKGKT